MSEALGELIVFIECGKNESSALLDNTILECSVFKIKSSPNDNVSDYGVPDFKACLAYLFF